MRGLDDTDREILRLLAEDARQPYSDIADAVDLSAPAVSDRVDRLGEVGLVRRFTVDLDRSLLREGVPVLLSLTLRPGTGSDVGDALAATDTVDSVFRTVDDRVVCTATVPEGDIEGALADVLERGAVRDYDVRLLADRAWTPRFDTAELAPSCAECDNTVTREGETERLDGDRHHFCCGSCRDAFVERYEQLSDGV
jgi:Lrp/AsnC family leucine-responsive transcriptional regulator